jgi:protein-S-isoprenylcysteine O-methyltransferase Ste14
VTDLLAGPGVPDTPVVPAPVPGNALPDPRAIQRVQRIRKAVLLVAILAVIGLSLATAPVLTGTTAHTIILGAGVIALVVAIVGRAWCSLYIGGRKKSEIVQLGPYSVSRNPLYVFSFLGAFGMGAQTGSLILAGLFTAIAMAVFLATVRREEAWLLGTFGEDYRRYRASTPRFWPRWSGWRDKPALTVAPEYFLTTLRDGSAMLLALPLFWGITALHQSNLLATAFRLI